MTYTVCLKLPNDVSFIVGKVSVGLRLEVQTIYTMGNQFHNGTICTACHLISHYICYHYLLFTFKSTFGQQLLKWTSFVWIHWFQNHCFWGVCCYLLLYTTRIIWKKSLNWKYKVLFFCLLWHIWKIFIP